MNKNEMITIELTRGEWDKVLLALREAFASAHSAAQKTKSDLEDIEHTFWVYVNLPYIADIYNVIATCLDYETRIILLDKENNK